MYFQAIAHYEQSADYYKGEESNRYMLFFISVMGFSYVVKDNSSLSSEHLFQKQVASGHVSSLLSLTLHCATFSSANKCLLKVAAYAAQLEQYQKAIEIYEQVRTPLRL